MTEPREDDQVVDPTNNSKLELTKDQELILKGKRPEGMPLEQYKFLRKVINKYIKHYLKGRRVDE